MKRTIVICCLLLTANFGTAVAQRIKYRAYDPLFNELLSVQVLSNHNPGFGGNNQFYRLSKNFLAIDRPADFTLMLYDRRPVVRAMGLLCLAQVDRDKYWLTLLSYLKDNEKVYLSEGCVVSQITIGEFAQQLLRNPDFLEANGKRPVQQ